MGGDIDCVGLSIPAVFVWRGVAYPGAWRREVLGYPGLVSGFRTHASGAILGFITRYRNPKTGRQIARIDRGRRRIVCSLWAVFLRHHLVRISDSNRYPSTLAERRKRDRRCPHTFTNPRTWSAFQHNRVCPVCGIYTRNSRAMTIKTQKLRIATTLQEALAVVTSLFSLRERSP
jgi:hypothetical protein